MFKPLNEEEFVKEEIKLWEDLGSTVIDHRQNIVNMPDAIIIQKGIVRFVNFLYITKKDLNKKVIDMFNHEEYVVLCRLKKSNANLYLTVYFNMESVSQLLDIDKLIEWKSITCKEWIQKYGLDKND